MTYDVGFGDLAPGQRIADFQVQEQVGRGGMAVVYRALDLRLGRLVALKVLSPALGEDEAFRVRFVRESRAAARVEHPHIIPVFDAGEVDGLLFIAMRYVGRGDVRRLLDAEGALHPQRVISITSQVASALDTAHGHGLVHRDVKPGNMLLAESDDRGDYVYLADFGLSKHSLTPSTLTAAGQFLGTLDYVAPEQIQGQPVDGRADQYALACTVVEMLVGSPPFRRDETMALMWAQLEAPPPRLTLQRPDLPPALDAVITTALSKSPAGRFGTCGEFAEALHAACRPRRAPDRWTVSATAELPAPQHGAGTRADRADPRYRPPAAIDGAAEAATEVRHDRRPDGRRVPGARNLPELETADRPATHHAARRAPARQAPRRRRTQRNVLLITAVALAALAVVGYRAMAGRTPAAAAHRVGSSGAAQSRASADATVKAYFAAINRHEYLKAWRLQAFTAGETFSQFKSGYEDTVKDTLKILWTTKNGRVGAQLTATQTDGSVKLYRGTYTVANGVIVAANVHQVG